MRTDEARLPLLVRDSPTSFDAGTDASTLMKPPGNTAAAGRSAVRRRRCVDVSGLTSMTHPLLSWSSGQRAVPLSGVVDHRVQLASALLARSYSAASGARRSHRWRVSDPLSPNSQRAVATVP